MYQDSYKINERHRTELSRIRELDPAQDRSKSGIFQRAVHAGRKVEDWLALQDSLAGLKNQKGAQGTTSFQIKYDEETAKELADVWEKMFRQLQGAGRLIRLQRQYFLFLLLGNYRLELEKARELALKADGIAGEGDAGFPEIVKILVEMILEDPKCSELEDIRSILVRWKIQRHHGAREML